MLVALVVLVLGVAGGLKYKEHRDDQREEQRITCEFAKAIALDNGTSYQGDC